MNFASPVLRVQHFKSALLEQNIAVKPRQLDVKFGETVVHAKLNSLEGTVVEDEIKAGRAGERADTLRPQQQVSKILTSLLF